MCNHVKFPCLRLRSNPQQLPPKRGMCTNRAMKLLQNTLYALNFSNEVFVTSDVWQVSLCPIKHAIVAGELRADSYWVCHTRKQMCDRRSDSDMCHVRLLRASPWASEVLILLSLFRQNPTERDCFIRYARINSLQILPSQVLLNDAKLSTCFKGKKGLCLWKK